MDPAGATRTIVIGVDGSPGSRSALRWGLREAERRRAPVLLAHSFGPSLRDLKRHGTVDPAELRRFHAGAERARALLTRTGAQARATYPLLDVETVAVNERPGAGLVACSRRADLLVLGTHGAASFAAVTVGSTLTHVASHATCTVVAVPPPASDEATARGIVVGVDLHGDSEVVLARAFAEAELRHEPLTVVHAATGQTTRTPAVPRPSSPGGGAVDVSAATLAALSSLLTLLAPWQARYPKVAVRRHVVHSQPPRALTAEATGSRLLVVGARATSRSRYPLGSVSHAVLHLATCPVAVVHTAIDLSGADRLVPVS